MTEPFIFQAFRRKEQMMNPSLPSRKVLIAEKEEHCVFLGTEILEGAGYEVVSTSEAVGLKELIKLHMPDVLILGLHFDECWGFDLMAGIRKRFPSLPVIAWTIYDSLERNAMKVGADDQVMKSFDMTGIKNSVRNILFKNALLDR